MNPKPNSLIYDDINHIYRLNSQVIPSTTQILSEEGLSDYSYADESDRMFGRAGHKLTELWDKKILDTTTTSPLLIPYLEGYKKFLRDFKVKVFSEWIERPICSLVWKYGVTPDRIAEVASKLTVYEIKFSSDLAPSVAIQTAAQKIAIEENSKLKIKQRLGLRLIPGDYRIEFYSKLSDERIWLSAVILNQFKKEHKLCKQSKSSL